MFKTILVGVDGREGGRDALALAAILADRDGAETIALHAYPQEYLALVDIDYDGLMRRDAEKVLDGEIAIAQGGVVVAETVTVRDSSPGRALHDWAARKRADLIVVGSAHHGPVGRVLAGDHVAATLHGSPCPVAVAPRGLAQQDTELQRVGVGFDGREESYRAVEVAAAIARAAGASLRVIAVAAPAAAYAPTSAYTFDWGAVARSAREELDKRVAKVVAGLDVEASGGTVVGLAVEELASASKDLDLLVVGSRDYGPVRRVLAGSTSLGLTRRAACPVLVVPRGPGVAGEEEAVGAAADNADAAR
jgi:nucleotide-binding universal stress UspA family protein